MKNKYKIFLFIIIFIFIIAISFFLKDYMNLEYLKENKDSLVLFVEENLFISIFIFIILCIVFINSPVPLAAFIKFVGGFLFGFKLGAFLNIFGTVLACYLGFIVSRYVFRDTFHKMYGKKLKEVEHEINNNGFFYFLMLRVVLIIPYFLINVFGGISEVKKRDFILSTMLGVIPASFIYAYAGMQIESINSLKDIFSIEIFIMFFLIFLLALLPLVFKHINGKKT